MTAASTSIRIGILGAARIAPKALIEPAAKLAGVEVTRVAARSRDRAQAFADEHDIAGVSDSYADLIVADDVDVVYNPLPMSLHAEWTIAALRAGKHVFCEKPFASNATEAAEMVRVADEEGLVLGEAFHYRYHPMFSHIMDEVASGRIGTIERVEGTFNVEIAKQTASGALDLRWDYETSGGSLMDLGCYPMSWVRHVTGEEPTVISAEAVVDEPKIDTAITCELAFPSGATGSVTSAMTGAFETRLTIQGSAGRIDAVNPMAPQVSGQDSINNMAAIDAVYLAAGLPLRGE